MGFYFLVYFLCVDILPYFFKIFYLYTATKFTKTKKHFHFTRVKAIFNSKYAILSKIRLFKFYIF
ncbi:hypothetical protein BpHYR1_017490 [Brachionus plicatilis]|uniref:Uncharacterized protein n=1 Tax=Brachionus plicatilis TaxID=10195 RepID=A0A3M7QPB6_BRAPC|nr:hypothetical protein BpHYR1_017490 [Brachionus plicatilis]